MSASSMSPSLAPIPMTPRSFIAAQCPKIEEKMRKKSVQDKVQQQHNQASTKSKKEGKDKKASKDKKDKKDKKGTKTDSKNSDESPKQSDPPPFREQKRHVRRNGIHGWLGKRLKRSADQVFNENLNELSHKEKAAVRGISANILMKVMQLQEVSGQGKLCDMVLFDVGTQLREMSSPAIMSAHDGTKK